MTTHKTIRPVEHDQETPLPGSGMQSGEVYIRWKCSCKKTWVVLLGAALTIVWAILDAG